jgi:rhamnose transport system permease protein
MRRVLRAPEFVPAALLVLAWVAGILLSPHFADPWYLLDSTSLYVEAGLLTLGMTFVIVAGMIDLSVAANLALSACVIAKLTQVGTPWGWAALIGVAFGTALGALNGALIAFGRLPSFLVTLGTMALFRGAAQALMGPESVSLPQEMVGIDRAFVPWTGVPWPLCIFLVTALAFAWLLHGSVFGREVFAVGTNESAAFFSAVAVPKVKLMVLTSMGLLAGIAGVLTDSRLGVARYDHAKGMELEVITAAVLGGAAITGGRGSILGSVLAVFLIGTVKTGMGLANIKSEVQLTVVGTLLVLTVALGALSARRRVSREVVADQGKP